LQDRGGEYRSVLGLPGGTKSPYYSKFVAAAEGSPMKLVAASPLNTPLLTLSGFDPSASPDRWPWP
jgi:hypothetical protein